ncbi:TPA: hypothetical protein IF904_004866 [Escherichia coli]|nr:hypothetical protein [Escherichia coli]
MEIRPPCRAPVLCGNQPTLPGDAAAWESAHVRRALPVWESPHVRRALPVWESPHVCRALPVWESPHVRRALPVCQLIQLCS